MIGIFARHFSNVSGRSFSEDDVLKIRLHLRYQRLEIFVIYVEDPEPSGRSFARVFLICVNSWFVFLSRPQGDCYSSGLFSARFLLC